MPRTQQSGAAASYRSATKRLLKEMDKWRVEKEENPGIERLGCVNEEDIFEWEAVINGRGIGSGYDTGRWLITIQIPPNYPNAPPTMSFSTRIVHPNIALHNGEICLDLLKSAWTPAYSICQCVLAVRSLLGEPETDSPLNVDAAALLRAGDVIGARRLVEYWIEDGEGRYNGE